MNILVNLPPTFFLSLNSFPPGNVSRNSEKFVKHLTIRRMKLHTDSIWRTLPTVYLTPHRAGGIIASVQRNIDWLIEDLENHIAGRPRKYPLVEAMIPSLDAQ